MLRVPVPAEAEHVLRYGVATGDLHDLHHRPDSAEAAAFGGCVVPGRYLLGVVARLVREGVGAALVELECAYLAPAPVGARLWLEVRGGGGAPELGVRVRVVGEAGEVFVRGRGSVGLG